MLIYIFLFVTINIVNSNRPKTQLFMLMSLDGKISTGATDLLDFDQDLPKISGVAEGLFQYYDIEKTTDIHSLNTGRVMAKIGANIPKDNVNKTSVRFIIIDNKPHFTETGVDYFLKRSKTLYLITTNKNHPAFKFKNVDNLRTIHYPDKIDLPDLFRRFKKEYGIKRITIQSGGTLNAELIRQGLIDKVSIVIAPLLVGGEDTPTIMDGESLRSLDDLSKIKPLKLVSITKLKKSYLHLKYDVLN